MLIVWAMAMAQCSGPQTPQQLRAARFDPGSGYQRLDRPTAALQAAANSTVAAGADNVFVSLYLLGVTAVDTKASTVTISATERIAYLDGRLAYPPPCVEPFAEGPLGFPASVVSELWTPDIHPTNLLDEEVISSGVWIRPTGLVLFARQVLYKLSCPMTFDRMPYDAQRCPISYQSNIYPQSKVVIVGGLGGFAAIEQHPDAAPLDSEWMLTNTSVEEVSADAGFARDRSTLLMHLELTRDHSYYELNVLPLLYLLMFFAYLSDYIPLAAVPARVTLPVVCFLTLVSATRSVAASFPKIRGDTWLFRQFRTAMYFVVALLGEFVICSLIERAERRLEKSFEAAAHEKKVEAAARPSASSVDVEVAVETSAATMRRAPSIARAASKLGKQLSKPWLDRAILSPRGAIWLTADVVENVARIGFPVAYFITVLAASLEFR